jgi:hypothetical protein
MPDAKTAPPASANSAGLPAPAGAITVPGTNVDILTLGRVLAESGYFRDVRQAAQAVVKVLAGMELGIGPIRAMTDLYVIEGKVGVGAGVIASRIKASGKYDYRVVRLDDTECEILFAQILPGGKRETLGTSRFTMDDARKAGLLSRPGSSWQRFPRNMLFARALSNGARWFTPDVFGGAIYTREELEESAPPEPEPPIPSHTPEDPSPAPRGRAKPAPRASEPAPAPAAEPDERGPEPAPEESSPDGAEPAAEAPPDPPAPRESAACQAASRKTPEELHALRSLVIAAAKADGYSGHRFAARWLRDRYGVDSLEAIPDNMLDRVIHEAIETASRAEGAAAPGPDEAPGAAPRESAAPAPSGGGNGSPRPSDAADRVARAFEASGEGPDRQRALLRAFTRGRADRIEDLSDAELEAFLDLYAPQAAAQASPPQTAPAA